MMKLNRCLAIAGLAGIMCLGVSQAMAQPNQGGGRRGGNFDPAQFRERMMERIKENLEITDNSEWSAIEPLIQKVMDARMATVTMGRGMMGPRRGRPGDNNNNTGAQARPQRGGFFGRQPNPEVETLQRAVDSKASNAELKTAIAKVEADRKAKQAELEKAQANLRKVLTVRQEAIATLNGWL